MLAHKHMSSEWTCRRTTETAAPTSWFERTPVRSGPGLWTGAVRRWRASTGWREQDPADTDGTDRCGMMFGLRVGAGCCQDRDQLNPPSERRQPLLGRSTPPSSLPSEVRFAKESLFWNGSLYWFSWTDSQRVCKSRLLWENISQFVWLSRKYN